MKAMILAAGKGTRVPPGVVFDERIAFKDYSVDRAGQMLHVSQYETEAWGNARDRRSLRYAATPPALYAAQ